MRHHIDDAHILIVADARYDGQGKLRHIRCHKVAVEDAEVAGRATATNDDRSIELLLSLGNGNKRRDDALLGTIALHQALEQGETKAVGCSCYLAHKILITSCSSTRHNGDAECWAGHIALSVHIPHAIALKLRNGLTPTPLHLAQGVGGVEVDNLQHKAVDLVEGNDNTHQDTDTCSKACARKLLEESSQALICRAPNNGTSLGLRRATF